MTVTMRKMQRKPRWLRTLEPSTTNIGGALVWILGFQNCEILSIFLSAALQMATATDIQDIADILGVTFQEHCSATPLKVFRIYFEIVYVFAFVFAFYLYS